MKAIFSKLDPSKLLHLVRTRQELKGQETNRVDLSPTHQFLQVASLKLPKDQTFKAHQHLWRKGEEKIIPQESWVVIDGVVQAFFYDTDGKLLASETLMNGDISITFEGGHNYLIQAENTLVYEFKSARYYGQQIDKVFI